MKFILRIFVTALALLFVTHVVPGIEIKSIYIAIIVALALGLLNTIVKPILVILTLPITILTLGLFILIINATLFLLAASFIEGFAVAGFVSALLGSILMSVLSYLINKIL